MSEATTSELAQGGCLEGFYRGLGPAQMMAGWNRPQPSAELDKGTSKNCSRALSWAALA
jgi:hypothetical protein